MGKYKEKMGTTTIESIDDLFWFVFYEYGFEGLEKIKKLNELSDEEWEELRQKIKTEDEKQKLEV